MSPEEVRLRSLYLFLASSRVVEQFKDRLAATFPDSPLTAKLVLEKSLRKEIGMLCRYWIARQIWDRLDAHESDAKQLNLALLRLFTDGFKLPKDGSGLRYAELSTPAEEAQELSRRITASLGMEHLPLLAALHAGILSYRDLIMKHTSQALELPLGEVAEQAKAWAREPEGKA